MGPCTRVYSLGLLSEVQGHMRSKSERKVPVSDSISLDIELAGAQGNREGVLKGKSIVGNKSKLLVLWFTFFFFSSQTSVCLSHQQ